MNRLSAVISLVALIFFLSFCRADQVRHNVLFIAIDDLRPELGCYGAKHIHSPNIDYLASTGLLFENAYCQQAVCNPSRTSLMTGLRPDSIGVTGNHVHFRTSHPHVVTLPQYFQKHGYHCAAIGKIYHGVFPQGASITKWDTMGDAPSWSEPAVRFGPRYYYTEDGIAAARRVFQQIYKPENPGPNDWTKKLVFGPATESPDVPDNTLYDGKVAEEAVKKLKELQLREKPFFLAVGFIKPHSPYIAPKKYFDRYDHVGIPRNGAFPTGAPKLAGHGSGELRRYTDQPKRGPISEENQRRIRQAYYACVSYVDAQIGLLLKELERSGLSKNTIVVLFGDHGYHLGEHGLWGKTTNFELDTRVPLIVRVPGMKTAGETTTSLVELVDLYPTLAELAGLPRKDQLDGMSFARVLNDSNQESKTQAISQYPRGELMGYSMRTQTHRLTQWIHKESREIRETELYDYSNGLVETANIAKSSPRLVQQLSARLAAYTGSGPKQDNENKNSKLQSSTSFESAKAGPFDRLENSLGVWNATVGRTIIDDKHAKTGKQCLQLAGGTKTRVTLDVADQVDTSGQLTFWAERWTRREPFSFRIEKNAGKDWKEVFNGDQKVRVGRAFLSRVVVPLGDRNIKKLRFTAVSPPNTGILIDDIRFAPARPQRIVSVEAVPSTYPALVGVEACPLLKLKITTEGSLKPISVANMRAALSCQKEDVESIRVYFSGSSSQFKTAVALGQPVSIRQFEKGKPLDIDAKQELAEGQNFFWVTCKLRQNANIDRTVGATCSEIKFTNGRIFNGKILNSAISKWAGEGSQRMGVALRKGGDDQVHTFRIPGLATTNKGTLIGVYDVRRRGGGDLPGDIDVGMSRSTDGGRSWEPMKTVMDMGEDPKWRYDGVGDPAVLVDRQTGTIWVAATWSHGNRSWVGSGPGMTPEETGQFMLVRSDDDGVTWSKPINITKQVKKPEWCFILQGPGKGITMRDGTIVFAAQYQDPPNRSDRRAHRLPHSTIIYSKDHGKTWHVGTGAFDDTTEAQVIESEPGVLMLNCRYNRKSVRVVMTTRDMGRTWQKHTTSERALIEPRACMASLINVDREIGKDVGNWFLFSNPDSISGRHHLTIKASSDRGMTWPKENRLLLDEGNSAGYSCLSMIDEKTIGILYEGSQAHMTFQRIPLKDLIESAKSQSEIPKSSQYQSKLRRLSLPRVFGDHMVLQADSQIPVWGRAKADEKVFVQLGKETRQVTADIHGRWSVRFPPRKASFKPEVLTINSAEERIQFKDIVFGEVWVCAGQSNMEWPLSQSTGGQLEISKAGESHIRLLNLRGGARGSSGSYANEQLLRLTADRFCTGQWEVASPESASAFSAVGWYFGRHLQKELDVPVGLICPAMGGTPTEAWIPQKALEADPDLKGLVTGNWLDNERLGDFCRTRGIQNLHAAIQAGEEIPGDELGPNHSFKPGFMWSAGIEPLIPYAIRGVIWYQGESNAETAERTRQHGRLFPLLINQWRAKWGQGNFPFLFVQLPALNRTHWPQFRDGQRRILAELKNVGMAITIDSGHPTNVHPALKKPVGERLARWALGTTYLPKPNASKHNASKPNEPKPNTPISGPLLDGVKRQDGVLKLSFKYAGDGVKSSDGKPLRYFEICGDDGVFRPARARIVGKNSVVVSNPEVKMPRHVRYAWLPYPDPAVNLFNDVNLPASPFSTEAKEDVFAERRTRSPAKRPNILFIVSEDNSDHLGCYGEQRVHTPHLDSLAQSGIRYTRAYVPYSVCSPSRAAFLTGLYTRQTGHIGLATHRFSMHRDYKTLPAYFQQAGYYVGFLGKTHINPERLVEDYIDHRAIRSSNFGKTTSIATYASEARTVMENAAKEKKPFLLVINYADAHRKFVGKSKHGFPTTMVTAPVKPFSWIGSDTSHLRDELRDYFNCLNRLDEGIGMVLRQLDELKVRENTLVVYISDHGADFPRGKGSIYENGTRIPMIVNYPKCFTAGRVESGMVSTIDILPTLLGVAGLPIPDHLQGIALQDLDSRKIASRQYIHTFTTGSSPNLLYMQFGIRDDRFKLVFNPDRRPNLLARSRYKNSKIPANQQVQDFLFPPKYELFDLQRDPDEWTNLADDEKYKAIRIRLWQAMRDFQREIKDPFLHSENIDSFISEQVEYQNKPYKREGFRWPHLKMFENAQKASVKGF